jgi:hypothetical protein
MNSKGERAHIEWNSARNAFRYCTDTGDPINYRPVIEALSAKHLLDADGFAMADAWMAQTVAHRYPLALERIVRGHTRAALNPATILISLDNAYVHAGWFVKFGSDVVRFGGTHGALDDLNSDGILLSSFGPTQDTSANRVATLYGEFKGLRNYRAGEQGAEWVSAKAQALAAIARAPLDQERQRLPDHGVLLHVWTPHFSRLGIDAPIDVTVRKAQDYLPARIRRGDPEPDYSSEQHLTLNLPITLPSVCSCERVYLLPSDLVLEPGKEYLIAGRIREGRKSSEIFSFTFYTGARGRPAAY